MRVDSVVFASLGLVAGVCATEDYTKYVNLLVGTQGAIPGVRPSSSLHPPPINHELPTSHRAVSAEVRPHLAPIPLPHLPDAMNVE